MRDRNAGLESQESGHLAAVVRQKSNITQADIAEFRFNGSLIQATST